MILHRLNFYVKQISSGEAKFYNQENTITSKILVDD